MHRIMILLSKKPAMDLLLKARSESKLTIRHASLLTHMHTHISVQLTSLTMILSSQVLSNPKCCRMDLTCSKANLSLEQRQMGNKLSQKFNAGFKGTNSTRCVNYLCQYYFQITLRDQIKQSFSLLLPLYLWEELCFKDASCLEGFRNLPSEQEPSLGHVYQDVPNNFAEIHSAAHFLISVKHASTKDGCH